MVEDDVVVASLLMRLLRNLGYDVRAADNAEAALRMVRADKYDGAVVDVYLPGMDGLALKPLLTGLGIGVLLTSGNDVAIDAMEHEHFLAKPFTMEDLGSSLKAVFGNGVS